MLPNMNQTEERYPDFFRERDVDWVFKMIQAGESCSLIGIGSVGKSNLMQALTTKAVKRRCLSDRAPTTLTVLIDPHKIVHLEQSALGQAGASWPGYEILLSRLRRSLTELEDDPGTNDLLTKSAIDDEDIITKVEALYINLFDTQPLLAQSGIRHLEESVYEVLRMKGSWRIAFLFDEIESFLHLPPEFFQSLRGLRDEFKERVMFVTSSRAPLDELVEERMKEPQEHDMLEGFIELFQGLSRYIDLLDSRTAQLMIRQLERRYALSLGNSAKTLMDITGCHAGLLRRSFRPFASVTGMITTMEPLFDHLLKDKGVVQECGVIFNSLSPNEQVFMRQVVTGQPVSMKDELWKSLSSKHLVTPGVHGEPTLMLPILGGYLFKEIARNTRV
jgi:hypothetical protein